jgi:uncharacterized protein DUF6152
MVRKASVVFAAVLMMATAQLSAHHSVSAEFDSTKPIKFTGTITRVEWTNPHIYTHVQVKEPDGKVTEYRVEGGPPNSLFRQGWRKDSLKTGETVTVSGIRAKNESSMNVGQATITMADGRRIFAGTGNRDAAQQQQ